MLNASLGSVSANTGEQLVLKGRGGVIMQERGEGGQVLSENHQQFGKKVKNTTALVAFFEILPKPSGVLGQEATSKLRMRIWCGNHGSYSILDFWLTGVLLIVSFSVTSSSGLHKIISPVESLFFCFQ